MGLIAFLLSNRTLAEIAGAAILSAALIGGFAWHERAQGARACERRDDQAHELQAHQEAARAALEAEAINREAATARAAVLLPVHVPDVRLCRYQLDMHPTFTATGGSDEKAEKPAGNRIDPEPLDPNAAEELARVGQRADAQIAILQDYVLHVCSVRP